MTSEPDPIALLDPTRADDPAFDPHGPQARRVRTAALAASAPPASRSRRRPGLPVALTGLAAAAALAVAVVILTASPAPDARAALQAAAKRTAAVDSGRAVWTMRSRIPADGYTGEARHVIRFDGEDLEAVYRSREVVEGRPPMVSAETFREVDGIGYSRDDSRPRARFERLAGGTGEGPAQLIARQADNETLVALVRGAGDVTPDEHADGSTTYRATTTAGEVEDAAPTAPGRGGPGWNRKVRLEVTVAADGLIRRVVVRDGPTTRTTDYSDLGIPQRIERP